MNEADAGAEPKVASEVASERPTSARTELNLVDHPRLRQIVRFWLGLAAAGGALAIVSAFLPWVALRAGEPETITGIETGGDGFITAALGLVVIVLAGRGWRRAEGPGRRTGTIILLVGFVVLSIPALDWADFRRTMIAVDATIAALTTPEIGLYGTALGGFLAIFGGWQIRRILRLRAPSATPSSTRTRN